MSGPQLDRLKRYPLVRGVRMQLHWHENPLYRFAARPDLCADPAIRRNVGHLADYGWSFDLQVFAPQMADAAGLAEACPDVTFILQHAGMLEDLSPQGRAAWRAGMARLAQCPNVVSKLSGLGTFIHRNDPAHIAGIVTDTVAIFGADRCLFGSNFPIEKLWTSYRDLIRRLQGGRRASSAAQRDAIFSTTAERVYRLGPSAPRMRLTEVRLLVGVERGGIAHARIEPKAVEGVAEVVVRENVPPRAPDTVAPHHPVADDRESPVDRGAPGKLPEPFEVAQKHCDEGFEIRAVPPARHMGFAEADVAARQCGRNGAPVVHDDCAGRPFMGAGKVMGLAFGRNDFQVPGMNGAAECAQRLEARYV